MAKKRKAKRNPGLVSFVTKGGKTIFFKALKKKR